jgi:hypothetical protein
MASEGIRRAGQKAVTARFSPTPAAEARPASSSLSALLSRSPATGSKAHPLPIYPTPQHLDGAMPYSEDRRNRCEFCRP